MNDDEDQLLYLGLGPMAAILLGGALMPLRGAHGRLELHVRVPRAHDRRRRARRAPARSRDRARLRAQPRLLPDPPLHAAGHARQERPRRVSRPRGVRTARGVPRLAAPGEGCGAQAAPARRPRAAAGRGGRTGGVSRPGGRRRRGVRPAPLGRRRPRRPRRASWRPPARRARPSASRAPSSARPPSPRPSTGTGAPATLRCHGRGLRVALVVGSRPVGTLDVWGNGRSAGREARRAVSGALATVLAAILDTARHAPVEPSREPPRVERRRPPHGALTTTGPDHDGRARGPSIRPPDGGLFAFLMPRRVPSGGWWDEPAGRAARRGCGRR